MIPARHLQPLGVTLVSLVVLVPHVGYAPSAAAPATLSVTSSRPPVAGGPSRAWNATTRMTLTPAYGHVLQTIQVVATSFRADEQVNVYWDAASPHPVATGTADGDGRAAIALRVPPATGGWHMIAAYGADSHRVATAFFRVQPSTWLHAFYGPPGARDVLVGAGFGPVETVLAYWMPGHTILGRTTTTAQGTFSGSAVITFTVPTRAHEIYRVSAVGLSSVAHAASPFVITPALALGLRTPSPGGTGIITGRGYGAHERVTLLWDCATARCPHGTTLGARIADARGIFSAPVRIPRSASDTRYALSGRGTTVGSFVTTWISVSFLPPTGLTSALVPISNGRASPHGRCSVAPASATRRRSLSTHGTPGRAPRVARPTNGLQATPVCAPTGLLVSWRRYPGAAHYDLQLWTAQAARSSTGRTQFTVVNRALSIAGTGERFAVHALPAGIFAWRVAAVDAGGSLVSAWSKEQLVRLCACAARPAPILPAVPGLGVRPLPHHAQLLITWPAHSPRRIYLLQLWRRRAVDGQRLGHLQPLILAAVLRPTQHQIALPELPPGVYQWRMAAVAAPGVPLSRWTVPTTFTIALPRRPRAGTHAPAPAAPQPTTVAGQHGGGVPPHPAASPPARPTPVSTQGPVRLAQAYRHYEVGAYYFSGWSHAPNNDLTPLLTGPMSATEPLIGWYDDSQDQVDRSIDQAAAAGITFFAFDWYDLARSPYLTDQTLNEGLGFYLTSTHRQRLKFCLSFIDTPPFLPTPSDWSSLVDTWVTHYFTQPDYERVNGKPLFIVFSPEWMRLIFGSSARVRAALDVLRSRARAAGLPGVTIAAGTTLARSFNPIHVRQLLDEGYDVATAYNYHGMGGERYGVPVPYARLVAENRAMWDRVTAHVPLPYIPVITAGWDQRFSAREQGRAIIYEGRTPQQFACYAVQARHWIDTHPQRTVGVHMVLLFAWNELGEGGTIIPNHRDGTAYADAVGTVFGTPDQAPSTPTYCR